MKRVTVTEAKARFSELLNSVEEGETVAVTRHGKIIARITPDEDERQKQIYRAIDGILELRKRNKPVTVDEIIAWKNEGRR